MKHFEVVYKYNHERRVFHIYATSELVAWAHFIDNIRESLFFNSDTYLGHYEIVSFTEVKGE